MSNMKLFGALIIALKNFTNPKTNIHEKKKDEH